MKKLFSMWLCAVLLTSCSTGFYEYQSVRTVKIYDSPKGPGSPASFNLPAGETVVVKNTAGAYHQVRYKDYYGWVSVDSLQKGKRSNARSFGKPEDGFVWDTSVSPTGAAAGNAPAKKTPPHNGGVRPNGGRGYGMHRQG